jgi:hypothetical protein
LTLKSNARLGMYQEIAVKGCNLFLAEVDSQQWPYIQYLEYQSKHHLPVKGGGFTDSPNSHYFPQWAKLHDPSK